MLEVLSSSFHFLQFPWKNTKLCASTKSGAGGSGGGLIPSEVIRGWAWLKSQICSTEATIKIAAYICVCVQFPMLEHLTGNALIVHMHILEVNFIG